MRSYCTTVEWLHILAGLALALTLAVGGDCLADDHRPRGGDHRLVQTLVLNGHGARRWEPKRLRLRLFTVPPALARTGRRVLLHLTDRAPWAALLCDGTHRLHALAVPA